MGLPVVVQRGELTDYDSGFAAGSLLLGDKDRVEAVLCVNDLMAFGLMDCARDVYNLSIPEDLSIIGFDNVAEARWGETAEGLLQRADAALYRAKAAGRDRMEVDG